MADENDSTKPRSNWKAVLGWEGFYEVSDQGHVWSVRRSIIAGRGGAKPVGGHLLKWAIKKSGYPSVVLQRKGKTFHTRVHILVLTAFVGPRPFPLAQCRHLNGVRMDASLGNLVWGTHLENTADRVRHGTNRQGEDASGAKLTREMVREMRRLRTEENITYLELGRLFGVQREAASDVCRRITWALELDNGQ